MFLSLCTFTGMAVVFPFMLPFLCGRNARNAYLWGFAALVVLNLVCAQTESFALLAVCCFGIGVARVALVLNTTFLIAPYMLGVNTLDMFLNEPADGKAAYAGGHARTVLMPVLYTYILCIVQFSNYATAWVAYEFRWQYSYLLVVAMLLAALLLVLLTFAREPAGGFSLSCGMVADALLLAVAMGSVSYLLIYGKTSDWFSSRAMRMVLAVALVSGGLFLWLQTRTRREPLLRLGIFRYRYTWVAIGVFLLMILANSATSFVTSYLKLSTPAGNLQSAAVSCWAIPGCLAGLALCLVMVFKGVHFRYIYAAGFLLMMCADVYMYFRYQTMGRQSDTVFPTITHYAGLLILYSVTCAFAIKRLPVRYFATWLFLMVAVRNVIAPAVANATYGNWLQERQQNYVTRLAADVRYDQQQAATDFGTAAMAGRARGADGLAAERLASTVMKGRLTLQATLVAMKDITGFTVWICLGSALLVLLLPYHSGERT